MAKCSPFGKKRYLNTKLNMLKICIILLHFDFANCQSCGADNYIRKTSKNVNSKDL